MSKFILSSKTIGVFADGKFYAGAYPGTPGEGESSLLLTAKSHFCAEEWDAICADLGLGKISPAQASEFFTDEECAALSWAISPKPWKCSDTEAERVRSYTATEAEYGDSKKSDLDPKGSEVALASVFKKLLGRMPQYSITTLAFRQGEVVSAKGRTYTSTPVASPIANPTALITTRLRFLSAEAIKKAVTAAGVTIPEKAKEDDIKQLAIANAALVLQELG